jgi:UDP-glucose 4-epimerase
MQDKQQKIVITGHKGFIGSHLYNVYKKDSYYDVVGIDIKDENPKDIRDIDVLRDACKDAKVIYHLAAVSSLQACDDNPTDAGTTNIQGTRNILEVAKENNSKVIFSSSASVYGNQETPCGEYYYPDPQNYYAKSKLEGEIIVQEYISSGVTAVILRLFNVYGKGANPTYAGVITNFIDKAMKNEPLIVKNGAQVRDFIHVSDVINAFQTFYTRSYSSQYPMVANIGTGQGTSILDLARVVIGLTGSSSEIIITEEDPGVMYSEASIHIYKMHSSYPPINIVTGLSRTLK